MALINEENWRLTQSNEEISDNFYLPCETSILSQEEESSMISQSRGELIEGQN